MKLPGEYRIIEMVPRRKITSSIQGWNHSDGAVSIEVRKIRGSLLGKKMILEVSVTKMKNNKGPDSLIFIEGFCLTLKKRIRAIMTNIESKENGYGAMSVIKPS